MFDDEIAKLKRSITSREASAADCDGEAAQTTGQLASEARTRAASHRAAVVCLQAEIAALESAATSDLSRATNRDDLPDQMHRDDEEGRELRTLARFVVRDTERQLRDELQNYADAVRRLQAAAQLSDRVPGLRENHERLFEFQQDRVDQLVRRLRILDELKDKRWFERLQPYFAIAALVISLGLLILRLLDGPVR